MGGIWGVVVDVILGIVGGGWLGQDATSNQDRPPKPLTPPPPPPPPKAQPQPYVPAGRDGVRINVSPPPQPEPTVSRPRPVTIPPPEPEIERADFPELWQWGPVPAIVWLSDRLRRLIFPENRDQPGNKPGFVFGKLRCNNCRLDPVACWDWSYQIDETTQKEHHQASFDAFADWLAYQTQGVPFPNDHIGDFYDQGAILWPMDVRDFSGGVTLLYGAQFLGDLFANWWVRSLNYDASTLRGLSFVEVEITRQQASWERNYQEDTGEIDSAFGDQRGLATSLKNILQSYRAAQQAESGSQSSVPQTRVILQNGANNGAAKLEKILAVKDFPFKVPVSLLLEAEDIARLEDPETAYEKIESIPQLILWLTKALDELIGKFPIKMEIAESDYVSLAEEFEAWEGANQDPDPNLPFYLQNDRLISFRRQNGKIVKTIKIPNLAEAVAEMLGADLISQQNQTLGLELATRSLLETGSSKNLGVQIHALAEAIADYLGFESQDKMVDVEYTYNPVLDRDHPENTYKRLLKPSTVQTPILEFTGQNGLEKAIATIQEVHGIVKAALTEGIGSNDAQLKRRLLDYAAELGIFPDPPPTPPGEEPPQDDFDRIIERIEWGFIDQPGMDQNITPYGRDYSKRPKIKRLNRDNEAQ